MSSSIIFLPLPVGTMRNMYHAVAPSSFASLYMFGMSSWFLLVKLELIINGMLCFLRSFVALIVPLKAPFCCLKLSCISSVDPSRLKATILMPDSFIFLHFSSVKSVPFVAMHILSPFSVPYLAISKRSFLSSGSPPESTMTGL